MVHQLALDASYAEEADRRVHGCVFVVVTLRSVKKKHGCHRVLGVSSRRYAFLRRETANIIAAGVTVSENDKKKWYYLGVQRTARPPELFRSLV